MPFCPLKISYGMLWHWTGAPLGKEGEERYELWHTAWINCCSVQRSELSSETYWICILFIYNFQLDFLGFPRHLQANAVPAPARGPRTLSSNFYPLIILHTISVLDDVNVPCSNSLINDRKTARCEVFIAGLIKVQSSGCGVVSTNKYLPTFGSFSVSIFSVKQPGHWNFGNDLSFDTT